MTAKQKNRWAWAGGIGGFLTVATGLLVFWGNFSVAQDDIKDLQEQQVVIMTCHKSDIIDLREQLQREIDKKAYKEELFGIREDLQDIKDTQKEILRKL